MAEHIAEENREVEFSPGSLLKQAREQAGMTHVEVAHKLKLTPQRIEELEADDYHSDTPAAFYRGYLKNYAELLGLDGQDIAENFSNYCKRHHLFSSNGPSFTKITAEKETFNSGSIIIKVVTWLIVLGLLYSVYYFVVDKKVWRSFIPANNESEVPAQTLQTEHSDGSLLLPVSTESETNKDDDIQTDDSQSEGSLILETTPQESGSLDEQHTLAQEDITQTDAPSVSTFPLELSFTDDCWIRVVDATGKVLALGIKTPKDKIQLAGVAPYRITLGKASAVELNYQQQAFDLSGYPDSRPAKITLGE